MRKTNIEDIKPGTRGYRIWLQEDLHPNYTGNSGEVDWIIWVGFIITVLMIIGCMIHGLILRN